jgi:hypothetical protein
MIWPGNTVWGTSVTVNARLYTKQPGPFDAINADIVGLIAAGAFFLMQSGALPLANLGNTGLPGAGIQQSGIQGVIQSTNIATVPDVSIDSSRPVPITAPLSATTTTSAVLTFGTGAAALAALAGVVPGMTIKDNTTPANITTQTVLSVNMATGAVTMSATSASVPSGDSITFTPAIGTMHLDAALSRPIVWDGNYWHDVWNGQIV